MKRRTRWIIIGFPILVIVTPIVIYYTAAFFWPCELIQYDYGDKAMCYSNLAIENNDPTLCERIPKELNDDYPLNTSLYTARGSCLRYLAKQRNDTDLCEKIQGFEREICILTLTNDTSVCARIETPGGGKDICFFMASLLSRDTDEKAGWCNKISGNGTRFLCTLQVEPGKA